MRRSTVLLTAATVAAGMVPPALADHGHQPKPAVYLVGGGVESINPTPDMLANDDFYLGGYGFGSGHVGNVTSIQPITDPRFATGILADGAHSRALAVSDGASTIVLSQIETQGYFNAYKEGPFGENEIRQDAATQIAQLAAAEGHGKGHAKPAPVPTASQIVVDSDHSHGGPDTAGVWGGVPTSYLKLVHDRTVAAIVDAWKAMRPATLTYGIAHSGVSSESEYPPQSMTDMADPWLMHNQFDYDVNNKTMDDQIRVLQARDPDTGTVLDTYVNFSAHPDVLGSSNRRVTGDYVGRLNDQIEQAFGGFGMDQVATLGREQPNRDACDSQTFPQDVSDQDLCALDSYAERVLVRVKEALALAQPLSGHPVVAMNSYLLTDVTTSGVLAGATYAGSVIGAPIGRAGNAPWYTGTVLGTSYFVGRIGSILITGGPGEMYAQIWQKVKDTVAYDAATGVGDKTSGITSVLDIGTAGDFLGYIIAPLGAYPEPARRSVLDGSPPPAGGNCDVPDPRGGGNPPLATVPSPVGCPDPIGNDNYFFNVSHTFGERLTCDFLRGAGDVLAGGPLKYWSTYDICPAFANDVAAPVGADTIFPQQPDLSAVMPHM